MAAVINFSCFLVLFAALVLDVSPAPTSFTTEYDSDLSFSNTYLQFFKIKELIEKINLKKFRVYQENRANGIEGPTQSTETYSVSTVRPSVAVEEDDLPEIDLTNEAIINDNVNGEQTALDTYQSNEATTITVIEETEVTTLKSIVEAATTDLATDLPSVNARVPTTINTIEEDSPNTLPAISEEDALLNEIDTGSDKFFISKESVESAKKFGYKILLKKINGKEVPVGKIKFSFPTLVEINPVEDEVSDNVSGIDDDQSSLITQSVQSIETTTTYVDEPVESSFFFGGDVIEVTGRQETTTEAALEIETETTTALSVTFQPPTLESVIPTVEALDEYTISEGVKQITEDAEVAIMEIKNQNPTETVVFEQCTAPFTDVEDMLMSLAKIIEQQTPMISEILTVGKSLKDETSPEILSRSGAKLLTLLEPFLESLVPTELSGCASESSNAMLISLSGMASQLDTIASNEINQDRANSLHKSATSLQLAAWVMAQLQSSVHTIYSQEGICGDTDSSTTEILGSLSKAITGYIPIVTMLGNQESIGELKETIQALNKAQSDIAQLEATSGTRLPGVECGATFSEMAEALEKLADFVGALESNNV